MMVAACQVNRIDFPSTRELGQSTASNTQFSWLGGKSELVERPLGALWLRDEGKACRAGG